MTMLEQREEGEVEGAVSFPSEILLKSIVEPLDPLVLLVVLDFEQALQKMTYRQMSCSPFAWKQIPYGVNVWDLEKGRDWLN